MATSVGSTVLGRRETTDTANSSRPSIHSMGTQHVHQRNRDGNEQLGFRSESEKLRLFAASGEIATPRIRVRQRPDQTLRATATPSIRKHIWMMGASVSFDRWRREFLLIPCGRFGFHWGSAAVWGPDGSASKRSRRYKCRLNLGNGI